jgi:hypothetical protein
MPNDKKWMQQKEAERAAKQRRTARKRGTNIAGAAIGGTLIAGALSSPKVRKGIKKTAKKVGTAVKNTVKNIGGKGDYVSDPNTGKMKREKKPKSNISKGTKKLIKKNKR